MVAGLNQMVARQSKMAIKNHNTAQHRTELKHTHINLAVLISKRRKGSQVERRRRQERGAKGVALQTSPATCRHPGVTGLFPGLPEKGGLELGPTRNQTRKFEFSAKRR